MNDTLKTESTLEENEHYRLRPSTSNQSKFKLDEKEFNESELENEPDNDKEEADIESTGLKAATSVLDKINEIANDNATVDSAKFHDAVDNEEDLFVPIEQNDEWRTKSKHIFILSEAGKPIYSL